MTPAALAALKNWNSLTNKLSLFNEEEVKEMLNYEIKNAARVSILERLHQRYSTLRTNRERRDLLSKAKHV